ncbi:unnamed protein product, partial [Ixodes pacificus]
TLQTYYILQVLASGLPGMSYPTKGSQDYPLGYRAPNRAPPGHPSWGAPGYPAPRSGQSYPASGGFPPPGGISGNPHSQRGSHGYGGQGYPLPGGPNQFAGSQGQVSGRFGISGQGYDGLGAGYGTGISG